VVLRSLATALVMLIVRTAAPAQTIAVVDPNISIPSNASTISFVIKINDMDVPPLKSTGVSFTDLHEPENSKITEVGSYSFIGNAGKRSYWLLTGSVKGLPQSPSETHFLEIRAGEVVEVISLSLHKPEEPKVSITDPPVPMRIGSSPITEIQVESSGMLSHVRLGQVRVVEEKTGDAFPKASLTLLDAAKTETQELTLSEPVQSVSMKVTGNSIPAGKFTGTVGLTSQEKPNLGSFRITIYSSSLTSKLEGFGLLLVGIATYFLITVVLKSRSRWLMALLPAARLRETTTGLLKGVEAIQTTTGFRFPTMLDAVNPCSLRSVLKSLEEDSLTKANYLPWRFVLPFGSQDMSMQYQTFLLTKGNQIASLQTIIQWGLGTVSVLWPEITRLNVIVAGNKALGDLDALACSSGPPGLLTTQIQGILSTLDAAIAAARAGAPGGSPVRTSGVHSSEQLTVQLEGLSWFVWIFWGLLTAIVGFCTLIGFNNGFGTCQDLIQCFLWGAGIPAIGQGLGSLSSGAVASAFSIQLPR
jgi:hypothetical protein